MRISVSNTALPGVSRYRMAGISLFGYKLPHREAAVVGLTGQRGMDMVNPAVSRPARHEHDLKTLVRRDPNHPSALVWGEGNGME